MSLNIKHDQILAVLLHDGWHEVVSGSFDIDAYEYSGVRGMIHEATGDARVCDVGFTFTDRRDLTRITGPLTSVLAVRRAAKTTKD